MDPNFLAAYIDALNNEVGNLQKQKIILQTQLAIAEKTIEEMKTAKTAPDASPPEAPEADKTNE